MSTAKPPWPSVRLCDAGGGDADRRSYAAPGAVFTGRASCPRPRAQPAGRRVRRWIPGVRGQAHPLAQRDPPAQPRPQRPDQRGHLQRGKPPRRRRAESGRPQRHRPVRGDRPALPIDVGRRAPARVLGQEPAGLRLGHRGVVVHRPVAPRAVPHPFNRSPGSAGERAGRLDEPDPRGPRVRPGRAHPAPGGILRFMPRTGRSVGVAMTARTHPTTVLDGGNRGRGPANRRTLPPGLPRGAHPRGSRGGPFGRAARVGGSPRMGR
jgi:hypothetical protein